MGNSINNIRIWSLQHVEIIKNCEDIIHTGNLTEEQFDIVSDRIGLNLNIIRRIFADYYAPFHAYLRKHQIDHLLEIYEVSF